MKKHPVTFQIYDYAQMFDAMNMEEAICDLFDIGVKDDTLGLLYNANKEVHMAVNTPYGISERKPIYSSVLQGILGAIAWPQYKLKGLAVMQRRPDIASATRGRWRWVSLG